MDETGQSDNFSQVKPSALAGFLGACWLLVAAPAGFAQTGPTTAPLDLQPGDRVVDHGAAVVVPKPGHSITAHAINVLGDQELRVETTWAGEVIVSSWGDETEAGDDLPSAAPDQCEDGERAVKRYKWMGTFNWYFAAFSTPSNVDLENTEEALRDAVRNIVFVNNVCGLPDQVAVGGSYQGRTSASVQINSNATCQNNGNGLSSVGFGTLPQGTLGYSCVWDHWTGHPHGYVADEGDVRLNSTHHQWIPIDGPNCEDRWSIEAVMTHERGHTYGLAHAEPEADHKWLTMSPRINGPCQTSETTLGLGDIRGLELKY